VQLFKTETRKQNNVFLSYIGTVTYAQNLPAVVWEVFNLGDRRRQTTIKLKAYKVKLHYIASSVKY